MCDAMSQTFKRTIPVSWDELHRIARALAHELGAIGRWTGVVAIARGGMVPAAIIARELGLRRIEVVASASYDDRTRGPISILSDVEALKRSCGDGSGWLVIDDIADTGTTMQAVRTILPRAHTAAIYVKPAGRRELDSFAIEAEQDSGIEFPWDASAR